MRQSKQFQKVSSIFYIVMGTLSLVLAAVILMIPSFLFGEDTSIRWFFVVMLVLYGCYRLYFGISQIKKRRENYEI